MHRIPCSSRSAAIAASVESGLRLSDGRRQQRHASSLMQDIGNSLGGDYCLHGEVRCAWHTHTHLQPAIRSPYCCCCCYIQPTKPIAASQVVIKNFSCQLLSSFHVLSPVLWSQEEQACNQHATQEQCVCQANQASQPVALVQTCSLVVGIDSKASPRKLASKGTHIVKLVFVRGNNIEEEPRQRP